MIDIKLKYGILGFARSGLAVADKLKNANADYIISDSKEITFFDKDLTTKYNCEFGGHSNRLLESDVLIVSPGVPYRAPIIKKAQEIGIDVISEIEFAYRIKHPNSKLIAITGSNGKSTTVSLIHHILIQRGYNSILAGNIGTAFSGCDIENPDVDFIVLEVSSFQLELIKDFKPDVAAVLNVTPDHLNRYDSFEHYGLTKLKIFDNLDANSLAIANYDDDFTQSNIDRVGENFLQFSLKNPTDCFIDKECIVYKDSFIDLDTLPIKGPHNVANMMSAVLCLSPYFNLQEIAEAAKGFNALNHRLEPVRELDGVLFVNDSKATNTDSVKYALQSYSNPIRVILGGSDKGEDFTVLIPYLMKHVVQILLIGETTENMIVSYKDLDNVMTCKTLEEAVLAAYQSAQSGDVILLSPACASYDMFNNFEHRGNTFKEIVRGL